MPKITSRPARGGWIEMDGCFACSICCGTSPVPRGAGGLKFECAYGKHTVESVPSREGRVD